MSLTPDKLKALFEDLGKPTLRGVRKCPKCGTYNGTRGISCKNKSCDVVFKEKDKRRGHSAEAVKIITGSNVQVFSVRLRDRGPDYRGFVQLPLVQDLDGNPAESVDPSVLAQAARCYVDTCSRNNDLSVQQEACVHIRAAINCRHEAQPLTLKNSVLNSLKVSTETTQAIWLLATETTGPLVQRVTKNIMVVKCKPSSKQPLGFLHFAFFETSRNRSSPEHKYQCSCRAFKSVKPIEESKKRCVHFYACLCAFASDEKLADEFSYYINLDVKTQGMDDVSPAGGLVNLSYSEDQEEAAAHDVINQITESASVEVVIDEDSILEPSEPKRAKKDEAIVEVQASDALLTLQEADTPQPKVTAPTKTVHRTTSTPKKATQPVVDETKCSLSFRQWLASVTERVNQTMHYQFDGNPDPLVFHAPQMFFDCIQQRISAGLRKKRLPNSTTGFIRKDALPLGTFIKYTWHITNILHVKQIFDTPEMPLEVTRSFVENRDNTYDLYEVPKVEVENANMTPIRPFELKTYLKVGNTAPDQKEPTPFIIEWIPDILPKSHIGELRIKFEYGHQRNGVVERRNLNVTNPVEVAVPNVELQTVHIHS